MVGKMRMIKKKEERSDGDIERGNENTLCEKKKEEESRRKLILRCV